MLWWGYACQGVHEEVRGQLEDVGFVLLPCGF